MTFYRAAQNGPFRLREDRLDPCPPSVKGLIGGHDPGFLHGSSSPAPGSGYNTPPDPVPPRAMTVQHKQEVPQMPPELSAAAAATMDPELRNEFANCMHMFKDLLTKAGMQQQEAAAPDAAPPARPPGHQAQRRRASSQQSSGRGRGRHPPRGPEAQTLDPETLARLELLKAIRRGECEHPGKQQRTNSSQRSTRCGSNASSRSNSQRGCDPRQVSFAPPSRGRPQSCGPSSDRTDRGFVHPTAPCRPSSPMMDQRPGSASSSMRPGSAGSGSCGRPNSAGSYAEPPPQHAGLHCSGQRMRPQSPAQPRPGTAFCRNPSPGSSRRPSSDDSAFGCNGRPPPQPRSEQLPPRAPPRESVRQLVQGPSGQPMSSSGSDGGCSVSSKLVEAMRRAPYAMYPAAKVPMTTTSRESCSSSGYSRNGGS